MVEEAVVEEVEEVEEVVVQEVEKVAVEQVAVEWVVGGDKGRAGPAVELAVGCAGSC